MTSEPEPLSGNPYSPSTVEVRIPLDDVTPAKSLSASQPTRVRTLVLALACGISFVLYLHRYTWGMIKKDVGDEFGWDTVTLGWLDGLFALTYGIAQIPSGMLCDWFGARVLLGSSILLWSLALGSIALAQGLASMTVARLTFGVAQAGCYPVLNKVSKNWFPLATRTTAQGWIATFFGRGGGAAAFFLFGTVMLGWWEMPWRWAIAIFSLLGLGPRGVLFILLFRNTPREHPWVNEAEAQLIVAGDPQAAQASHARVYWPAVLRSVSFWFLLVRGFASNLADVVYVYWVPLYLLEEKGLSHANAGWLAALPLIGGALGGLFSGALQSKLIRQEFNRRWVRSGVALSGKLLAAGFMLLSLSFNDPLTILLIFLVVKFFSDCEQPAEWGAISDIAGRTSATIFACVNSVGAIGGFVASLLIGVILARFSIENKLTTAGWTAVFVVIAAEYVVAGLAWLFIDCRRTLDDPRGSLSITNFMTRYGINLSKDVMLPMRNGVRLASDIYRPAFEGEIVSGVFPTILCRTPYDKSDKRYIEIADFFTPRGYVTVLQDLRDRYRSEGRGEYFHTANRHDGTDGYDTIEWIAGRPWSNGRVGMVGSSFAGLVQTRAALERPPHLTAIWPDVAPTNSFAHQAREGGAMQLHMFWALFMHAQDAHEIRDDPAAQEVVWDGLRNIRRLLAEMPFRPGETPLAVVPNLEKSLFDYYYRGTYDEFWRQECNDFERYFARHADVPGTFTGGWFDPYSPAMTAHFAAMAQQSKSPQRLILGPWTHVAMRGDTTYVGEVDFGAASVWGVSHYFEKQLRWFDRWLKNSANEIERDAPVRIFVMGGADGRRTPAGKFNHGGRWRDEHEWPLARTEYTKFYFHTDGGLTTNEPAENTPPRSFIFDPQHPVPTIGGSLCGIMELPADAGDLDPMWKRFLSPVTRLRHVVPIGPAHQAESAAIFGAQPPYPLLGNRPDVLVFRTPPLARPIEVTGPIVVNLWISSSAVDTDFTAKLIDVSPPNDDYLHGFHLNLVDSVLRARFRNGWEREALMEPGEVYPISIELPPTSNLFAADHRIRVDISSSNFPRLDVNPNTGEPLGRHTKTVIAENTVFIDRSRPSHVVLPIIPEGL